jgi:hypothetical protein
MNLYEARRFDLTDFGVCSDEKAVFVQEKLPCFEKALDLSLDNIACPGGSAAKSK